MRAARDGLGGEQHLKSSMKIKSARCAAAGCMGTAVADGGAPAASSTAQRTPPAVVMVGRPLQQHSTAHAPRPHPPQRQVEHGRVGGHARQAHDQEVLQRVADEAGGQQRGGGRACRDGQQRAGAAQSGGGFRSVQGAACAGAAGGAWACASEAWLWGRQGLMCAHVPPGCGA